MKFELRKCPSVPCACEDNMVKRDSRHLSSWRPAPSPSTNTFGIEKNCRVIPLKFRKKIARENVCFAVSTNGVGQLLDAWPPEIKYFCCSQELGLLNFTYVVRLLARNMSFFVSVTIQFCWSSLGNKKRAKGEHAARKRFRTGDALACLAQKTSMSLPMSERCETFSRFR